MMIVRVIASPLHNHFLHFGQKTPNTKTKRHWIIQHFTHFQTAASQH